MQKSLIYTYIVLILLTMSGAVLASFSISKTIVGTIIALSVIKFMTVAFQFMELKEAHIFWKIMLIAYCGAIGVVLLILL